MSTDGRRRLHDLLELALIVGWWLAAAVVLGLVLGIILSWGAVVVVRV